MTDEQKHTSCLVRADVTGEWPGTGEVDIRLDYPGWDGPIEATVPGGAVIRDYIDFVCDGPPSHESGRFVEVENERGFSIRPGEWIEDGDLWRLRVPYAPSVTAERDRLREVNADLLAALEAARDFLMDGTPAEDLSPLETRTLAQMVAAIARARGEAGNG